MKEKITVLGTRLWTWLANVGGKNHTQEQEIRLKNGIVLFKKHFLSININLKATEIKPSF